MYNVNLFRVYRGDTEVFIIKAEIFYNQPLNITKNFGIYINAFSCRHGTKQKKKLLKVCNISVTGFFLSVFNKY